MLTKTIQESLAIVQIDFDIWSGQTRLRSEDFKLGDGGEIPPEKLAQLGTKRICAPEKLKSFHKIKQRARRLLESYGRPFLQGYGVPVSRLEEINSALAEIEQEFQVERQKFLKTYEESITEWKEENPEYADAIDRGMPEKSVVSEKIGFEYLAIRVQPADGSNVLDKKVERFGSSILNEVVDKADEFFKEYIAGKSSIRSSTKKSLINLRNKLDGLSFVNGNLIHLVRLLDQVIDEAYATTAAVAGKNFYQVMAAMLILSSHDKIKDYSEGLISLDGFGDSLWDEHKPVIKTSDEPQNQEPLEDQSDKECSEDQGHLFAEATTSNETNAQDFYF